MTRESEGTGAPVAWGVVDGHGKVHHATDHRSTADAVAQTYEAELIDGKPYRVVPLYATPAPSGLTKEERAFYEAAKAYCAHLNDPAHFGAAHDKEHQARFGTVLAAYRSLAGGGGASRALPRAERE